MGEIIDRTAHGRTGVGCGCLLRRQRASGREADEGRAGWWYRAFPWRGHVGGEEGQHKADRRCQMMVHLLAGGSGPPSTVSRSVSPRMRSKTFSVAVVGLLVRGVSQPAVSLGPLTNIDVVPRTRLDPCTLELARQLLALFLAHLPGGSVQEGEQSAGSRSLRSLKTHRWTCRSLFWPTTTQGTLSVPM